MPPCKLIHGGTKETTVHIGDWYVSMSNNCRLRFGKASSAVLRHSANQLGSIIWKSWFFMVCQFLASFSNQTKFWKSGFFPICDMDKISACVSRPIQILFRRFRRCTLLAICVCLSFLPASFHEGNQFVVGCLCNYQNCKIQNQNNYKPFWRMMLIQHIHSSLHPGAKLSAQFPIGHNYVLWSDWKNIHQHYQSIRAIKQSIWR